MLILLMVIKCRHSVACVVAQATQLFYNMLCTFVLYVLLYSVNSVQFTHFPELSGVQYRYGVHKKGQEELVGEGLVREKNGNVQDLIDFVSDHSDDEENNEDREKKRQRMKKTEMITQHNGGNYGREKNVIKIVNERKNKDGNNVRIKQPKVVPLQLGYHQTGRRIKIMEEKNPKKDKVIIMKGEELTKTKSKNYEVDKKNLEENLVNEPKNKHLESKKVKKIRKSVKGNGFGEKTLFSSQKEHFALPSDIVESRLPAPDDKKILRRKLKPKKVIKEKNKVKIKDEQEEMRRKGVNKPEIKSSAHRKRSKHQKRQFKNPLSFMFSNIIHRDILTQA